MNFGRVTVEDGYAYCVISYEDYRHVTKQGTDDEMLLSEVNAKALPWTFVQDDLDIQDHTLHHGQWERRDVHYFKVPYWVETTEIAENGVLDHDDWDKDDPNEVEALLIIDMALVEETEGDTLDY